MDDGSDDTSGQARPLWLPEAPSPWFGPLERNLEVDVCVVGAGIAGLSVAYHLARAGRSVAVLEDGQVGSGETGRTSAHLANALDDRFDVLERLHGLDGARLAAQSHAAAIDWIELVCLRERIDCDFQRVPGFLFLPPGGDQAELESEFAAAHRAGLAVSWAERAPLPLLDTGRCLRFARQAQFHPMRYLDGLAQAVLRLGGRIFTGTHVASMTGGEPAEARTSTGLAVRARHLVVATNTPVSDRVVMHTKQAAYRTYVIGAEVPRGAVTAALYWDTPDPYHYVRVQKGRDGDVLIVGGEDHKTGQADDAAARYARLEAWARERFPVTAVRHRWSGQVMEPVDGLGFIGRNPWDKENVYVATGDSGNGLTHGTIAGMVISDLVLGRRNPWAGLYDPSRVTLRAAGTFGKENVNAAAKYGDWLTPGEAKSVEEIPPGCGEIVRQGVRKAAVYRDEAGAVHACSAVCPHLKAIVRWNDAEKTWDCPAHGSRFDPYGKVLNGPANGGLAPIEMKEEAPARRG